MILSTVAGMVVLGGSGIREVSRFSCAILADLAMRGMAISFFTLLRLALPGAFLGFLCGMNTSLHQEGRRAAPFCTVRPPIAVLSYGAHSGAEQVSYGLDCIKG